MVTINLGRQIDGSDREALIFSLLGETQEDLLVVSEFQENQTGRLFGILMMVRDWPSWYAEQLNSHEVNPRMLCGYRRRVVHEALNCIMPPDIEAFAYDELRKLRIIPPSDKLMTSIVIIAPSREEVILSMIEGEGIDLKPVGDSFGKISGIIAETIGVFRIEELLVWAGRVIIERRPYQAVMRIPLDASHGILKVHRLE